MRSSLIRLLHSLMWYILSPFVLIGLIISPKRHKKLLWGCTPIINNKYWSDAMQQAGFASNTIMHTYYSSINKRDDYDYYLEDFVPSYLPGKKLRRVLAPFFAFFIALEMQLLCIFLLMVAPWGTPLWKIEAFMYKWAGIKIIIIPYGADAYLYSQIIDTSLRNILLTSYPDAGKNEKRIKRKVDFWISQADIVIAGFMIDGIGRWDCTIPSYLMINTDMWKTKSHYSQNNGYNGPVKIIHTPNHRGFKGTEFLINAIEELKREDLQIDFYLIENIQNDEVRKLMTEVDILAEQFIFTGYALSGIEGMASGLPVTSNLDHEAYTRLFRRYSYLDECPILSTTPENLKEHLRILITHPELREELGRAGRLYVEKYHSYTTAQYLFGSVYDKILYGNNIDLMRLFHPLTSEYNRRKPYVQHPLIENRLSEEYTNQC